MDRLRAQVPVSRCWTVVAVGLVVVIAACAEGPPRADHLPAGETSAAPAASSAASPTPSPSPSPVAPLTVSAAPFHAGELGLGYTPVSPTATGGVPPYTWDVSEGALPSGLVMTSSDGMVTGTPANLGTYLFTVRVVDSGGRTATLTSSISISKRLVITGQPCTPRSPCSVEAGCVTVCGTFAFQADGIAPFGYSVVAGSLPTGMGLNGLSLTNAFPAPASAAGLDWVFTVRITDAIGATADTAAQFHVFPHIVFTAASASCSPPKGAACSATLGYAYGTPGLTNPAVIPTWSPNQPAGSSVSAGGGTVAVSVPAGACQAPQSVWTVTLVLQDGSTCAANQYCTSSPAKVTVTLTC